MKLRITTFTAAVIFAAAFVVTAAPKEYASAHTTLSSNGTIKAVYYSTEQYYILCECDNQYDIMTVRNDGSVTSKRISVDAGDSPYAYYDDMFYFYTNDADVSEEGVLPFVRVTSCNCLSGEILTRTINDAQPICTGSFAYDGNCYYLPETSYVNIYDSKYMLQDRVSLEDSCISVEASHFGDAVYCICTDSVVKITDKYIDKIDIKTDKIYSFGDKVSDSNSVVYNINDSVILYSGFDRSHGVGEIGGWLIGVRDGMVTAVNGETELGLFEVSGEVYISGCGSCVCASQDGSDIEIEVITQEMIAEKLVKEEPCESSVTPHDATEYTIDYTNRTICGIPVSTTAAALKRETGGIVIDKDGSEAKGGAATGMRLVLDDAEYVIIIAGDLNGSGTVNRTDLNLLCDHICSENILEGEYLGAADMNDDDIIDMRDIVILKRKI